MAFSPSKGNTISHLNGQDSYRFAFLKDSKRQRGSQAVPGVAAGMEDRGDQDESPRCHHFPGVVRPARQAKRGVRHRWRMETPACPGIPGPPSIQPWGTLVALPAPHEGAGHPCVYVNRAVAGVPPGGPGARGQLFVYLVSVVTEERQRPGWVSGATRCWGPSCLGT